MILEKLIFQKFSVFAFLFFGLNVYLPAQNNINSPDYVVEQLYQLVTFEKGETPDWEAVKELFLKEAVIVLRTSYTESAVLNLDGFVRDFVDFIQNKKVSETGFSETIIKKHTTVFGDIASFLVLYEAHITGSPRKTVGVDHISLMKKEGTWKIVSITNELPTAERTLPKELSD